MLSGEGHALTKHNLGWKLRSMIEDMQTRWHWVVQPTKSPWLQYGHSTQSYDRRAPLARERRRRQERRTRSLERGRVSSWVWGTVFRVDRRGIGWVRKGTRLRIGTKLNTQRTADNQKALDFISTLTGLFYIPALLYFLSTNRHISTRVPKYHYDRGKKYSHRWRLRGYRRCVLIAKP